MDKRKAPDGGWSWFVCLGSSLITLSLRCIDPSFGLLFGPLLQELHVSSTMISLIMSIADTIANFSGFLVGPLLKKFSYNRVALVASLINCSGLMLTSTANSIIHIIVTYSILGGIGSGVAVACCFVAINTHFQKKRGRAVGFSASGTLLGMMIMPQVIRILLPLYGFSGTILILGAFALHSTVGSCLLWPLPKEKIRKTSEDLIDIEQTITNLNNEDLIINENKTSQKTLILTKVEELFDLDLLNDYKYLIVVIGCSFYHVAESNYKLMTTFFLFSLGIGPNEVASYLSLTAFTDILARLTMPTFFDNMKWQKRKIFWICSLWLGIGRSVIAESSKGTKLTIMFAIMGFIRGMTLVNMNLSISECCSLNKLPSAIGMYMVSKGVFVLSLSPLIGYVRDYTGSYRISIHMTTLLVFITFILWTIEYSITYYCKRKTKTSKDLTIVSQTG